YTTLFRSSSVLEDKFSIDGIKKGLLLAIPLLALSIASYVTGKKIKNNLKVMKWVTFIGIGLTGIWGSVISFLDHFAYLIALFVSCGSGSGMARPSREGLITKRFDQTVRGAISSIYTSMRCIGGALGPPVIALLMKKHIFWIVGILTIFAIIAGILAFRNIDPEETVIDTKS